MINNFIKPHGLSGFKKMIQMSNLTISISIVIFILSFFINDKNIETMKYVISTLSSISFISHIIELYIIGNRLFNQVKTNLFSISVLLKLILSNILSFSNIYYSIFLFKNNSFSISKTDLDENSKNYQPKIYFTFFYFSVYTLFTQGYGDVFPDSMVSRGMSMVQMILSYVITAYIFSKILVYSEERKKKLIKKKKN